MSTSKFAALSLSLAIIFAPPGVEAGVTGGATEVTQLLNNFQLIAQVYEQVRTVSELVTSNIHLYNQLKEQIRAGLSIGGVSLGDVLKLKSDLESYQTAIKKLGADLPQLGRIFDLRMTEARLQNISLETYVTREAKRISQGNSMAKARVAREIAQIEQIKKDYALVRELGDKIPSTSGVHASSQLLNSQMNVMLQQMTRLVTLTQEAQGSDKAIAMDKETNAREAAMQVQQGLRSMQEAQKGKERAEIEAGRR